MPDCGGRNRFAPAAGRSVVCNATLYTRSSRMASPCASNSPSVELAGSLKQDLLQVLLIGAEECNLSVYPCQQYGPGFNQGIGAGDVPIHINAGIHQAHLVQLETDRAFGFVFFRVWQGEITQRPSGDCTRFMSGLIKVMVGRRVRSKNQVWPADGDIHRLNGGLGLHLIGGGRSGRPTRIFHRLRLSTSPSSKGRSRVSARASSTHGSPAD